jgi:hypothetical protein
MAVHLLLQALHLQEVFAALLLLQLEEHLAMEMPEARDLRRLMSLAVVAVVLVESGKLQPEVLAQRVATVVSVSNQQSRVLITVAVVVVLIQTTRPEAVQVV